MMITMRDHGDEHGDDDHDDDMEMSMETMIMMIMMNSQILYMLITCKKTQNSEDMSLNLVELSV